VFHVLNIDGRFYMMNHRRVQPFLFGGVNLSWLICGDSSANRGEVRDATFQGVGFNAAAGLAIYVHRRIALNAGYTYRLIVFSSAKGAADTWKEIDGLVRGGSAGMTSSLTFTF
jgi:hypothetical protein